jgi:septal ring factor EnvC (AmiA/AmiB activator)
MTDTTDFDRALTLLAVIADAPGCKARLAELQEQVTAAAKAQAKLEAERAEYDWHVAATKAELHEREQALRSRQVKLAADEAMLRETQKFYADRLPLRPHDANLFGSITREPA